MESIFSVKELIPQLKEERMKFDQRVLRARIIEKYGSASAFARELRWSKSKLSQKLSGKSEFSRSEIACIAGLLNLSAADTTACFFTPESLENTTGAQL